MRASEFKTRSIRLTRELMDKIEEKAKEENRNFNNMVETILIKYIKNDTKPSDTN